jgi:hypothetical protein
MKTLRLWWSTKTDHKKQNWYMLAIVLCILASGFVEFSPWLAGLSVLPAAMMVALELSAQE